MQLLRQNVGMAIVGLDHRFAWVNPGLCEMLGYSAADLIGRAFEEITHPSDVQLDAHLAGRVLNGELSSYQFEKRYIDRSGKVVPVHLTVSMIRDSRFDPVYFLALIEPPRPDMPIKHSTSDIERIRTAILM
jgi:PAS domain S-box-containing protein